MEHPLNYYYVFEELWKKILSKFNSYTPNEDFDNHTSNNDNPHSVTAEQIGATPITGGTMEGTLTVHGIVLTEGVDYGSGNPSGGVEGQLYFKKVT